MEAGATWGPLGTSPHDDPGPRRKMPRALPGDGGGMRDTGCGVRARGGDLAAGTWPRGRVSSGSTQSPSCSETGTAGLLPEELTGLRAVAARPEDGRSRRPRGVAGEQRPEGEGNKRKPKPSGHKGQKEGAITRGHSCCGGRWRKSRPARGVPPD